MMDFDKEQKYCIRDCEHAERQPYASAGTALCVNRNLPNRPFRLDESNMFCTWMQSRVDGDPVPPFTPEEMGSSTIAYGRLQKTSDSRPLKSGVEDDINVNHPRHYTQHPSGVECIQVTEHMNFCLGNAMKYIWRADLKADAIEDLKKAEWYIRREIARREAEHGREEQE